MLSSGSIGRGGITRKTSLSVVLRSPSRPCQFKPRGLTSPQPHLALKALIGIGLRSTSLVSTISLQYRQCASPVGVQRPLSMTASLLQEGRMRRRPFKASARMMISGLQVAGRRKNRSRPLAQLSRVKTNRKARARRTRGHLRPIQLSECTNTLLI